MSTLALKFVLRQQLLVKDNNIFRVYAIFANGTESVIFEHWNSCDIRTMLLRIQQ